MGSKRFSLLTTVTALTIMLTGMTVRSQSTFVFATDLIAPTKIILTPGGNLLVAEAGSGPNTGRISLIDRSGHRRTLLDGLPSGRHEVESLGPSGLALRERTLFITIGQGDAIVFGEGGTLLPNPNGPSSPILSSVLAVHFSQDIDRITSGYALTLADHFTLANGFDLTLDNADGDRATVELLADFRDYVPDPNTIVRESDPFGLVLDAKGDDTLYVVDAGMNSVVKVNIHTGRAQTLLSFAPLPNPLPFGPPMMDAVPDSIHFFGDQLLVTLLTGFPFPSGAAEIRKVDVATRRDESFITGLTTAIDVLAVRTPAGDDQFFVLEFSTDFLNEANGRLLRFDSPTATPVVIADLITPTSMARDPVTGDLFVTEIFTGRIIRVQTP
jgi:hypothetical protein